MVTSEDHVGPALQRGDPIAGKGLADDSVI